MELDPALLIRLKSDSGVAAIVADRVTWIDRPQGGELPALVLQRFAAEEVPEDLDGPDGTGVAHVQASAFALSHREAVTLAKASIAALVAEAQVDDPTDGSSLLFWAADSISGPLDLGQLEDTTFVHHSIVDFALRYAKV